MAEILAEKKRKELERKKRKMEDLKKATAQAAQAAVQGDTIIKFQRT